MTDDARSRDARPSQARAATPRAEGPEQPEGPGGGSESGERLACGAEPAQLLAQVCEGNGEELTGHQASCPHCRAELKRCRRLWSPFDGLAREPVRAPEAIVARALAWIRDTAGDGARAAAFPMESSPHATDEARGGTWVSARVVIRSARLAAEQVEGVRVALGHLVAAPAPSNSDPAGDRRESDGGTERTVLEVAIAADYGQDLHALADRIRARVASEVQQLTGRAPGAVDVLVDEVLPRQP